ncbi:MAG: sulfurtransferase [Proteobacteria bacterium]|nr:sulfurtransferase [Pseudomonadota bacterium]MBS0464089.1 sulfurtransferase [Pseudomonadota bacterium]
MNDWVVLHPMHWTTLVSAEELVAALGQPGLAIIDARATLADPLQGDRDYAASHIPGAVHANMERDLSDHSRKGHGRHPLPAADTFCRWLELWGITPAHQVVVYDAREGAMAAARVWFMLRLLGHQHVAVLDGGYARWLDLHLPISTKTVLPNASTYQASYDAARLADPSGLLDLARPGAPLLIDARPGERFRGEVEPVDRVAGHVPGAINRPLAMNLQADGRFRPAAELAASFRELLGVRDPSQIVSMCGSGITACHNLLALEHAGLRGARLYADSWSGWIADPARPVTRS